MTSAKNSSCSMNEVRGFVNVQHGRQQTGGDELLWDTFVSAGAAEDKHGRCLTLNPFIIRKEGVLCSTN